MLQIKVLPESIKESFLVRSFEDNEFVLYLNQDIFKDDERLRAVIIDANTGNEEVWNNRSPFPDAGVEKERFFKIK